MITENDLLPVSKSPLGIFDNAAYNLVYLVTHDPIGVAEEVVGGIADVAGVTLGGRTEAIGELLD